MAAGRSLKSLVGRRRRVDDEGEEDEGAVVVVDSQSEGSILSDADDDDADESSFGGPASADAAALNGHSQAVATETTLATKARKPRKKSKKSKESEQDVASSQSTFKAAADTEAMMHGLRIDDQAQVEGAVDFEDVDGSGGVQQDVQPSSAVPNGYADNTAQRQRQEHEDYRKKRDSDPAFTPNRGNFFMHDTRGQPNGQGQPPIRGAWANRGRGRGGANVGGPFSPANHIAQAERAAQQPWKHDLHDTINETPAPFPVQAKVEDSRQQDEDASARLFPKPAPLQPQNFTKPQITSSSSGTLVGKVQIRVLLQGAKAPIIFSEVPWRHYLRLPDHRPPLRRDKPVRISLPPHTQRYIFPSPDRSFIFIPRQMRPNQPSFGRESYQRSVAGFGPSSRRTSMYGGSVYSASVAASRRSSIAGVNRENTFSPHSFASAMPPPKRPVVRLPHGAQPYSGFTTPSGHMSGVHTPTGMPQIHTFAPPQQFPVHSTPTTTVHQPKPQKAISVTGIESPAALQQAPPPTEPQPFQNQLPAHMNDTPSTYNLPPPAYYSPRQQMAYPQQPHSATPLSGIPEQAMQAPPFQPPPMQYGQQPYYQPFPPQQAYYYSPPGPNSYPSMPMYMPPQGYMIPPPAQPEQPQQPPSQPSEDQPPQSQSGMVAHESNGMVFYLPASEASQQEQSQNYQPAESFVPSYAMPGLPPPTPAPETTYYYPPQMSGMPPMQPMFYPGQQ